MSKNILVLTGSPRKNGNSDKLADAFIAGARTAGHTVTKYTTANKNIKGCVACCKCFSKKSACAIDDDFNDLAEHILQAEIIVYATPLYWFTFPAQLKTVIDRFYCFFIGERNNTIKMKVGKTMLLACCGDSDLKVFDGLVTTYHAIAAHMKWQDSGILLVPGLRDKDDINATNALEQAEIMGKTLSIPENTDI